MGSNPSVSIVPYTLRVKKHGKDEFCVLDEIKGFGHLFHAFRKFLQSHQYDPSEPDRRSEIVAGTSAFVDEIEQNVFRVSRIETTGEPTCSWTQTVEALVEIGDYGLATKLYNVETAEERFRHMLEADLAPFYVRFDVCNRTDTALLIIQEYGKQHSRGKFVRMLKRFFSQEPDYQGLILKAESFVTEDYLEQITSGGIKSIRCSRKMQPRDVAAQLVDGLSDEPGQIEIVIKPPKRQFFSMKVRDVVNALKGLMPTGRLISVEDETEYENVKIEIEFGGRRRTINLNRREGLLPYMNIDISKDVEFDEETNHPSWHSLRTASYELVKEMCQTVGWSDVPKN